ncbi:MAG: hypothetical protein Q8N18_11115 [Opitutaceae bacterium]|nr:hypothetical protein [Opitutaceae bacterium]
MNALGEIEIHIEGRVGAQALTPALVDIEEIRAILGEAADLLFPTEKRSQRPVISYEISEGSVRHRFRTVMQTVIAFGAVIAQVGTEGHINFLHERTAAALESLQRVAREKDYVVTLLANQQSLRIDRTTHYERSEQVWVEAEFYLYGELTNAGGKNSPNIHLDTKEHGTLRIAVEKDYLRQGEKNLLYKKFGVRVAGRQNLQTFEMDPNSLRFIELLDQDGAYSQTYLDGLLHRAAPAWTDVADANAWLAELRGGAHA